MIKARKPGHAARWLLAAAGLVAGGTGCGGTEAPKVTTGPSDLATLNPNDPAQWQKFVRESTDEDIATLEGVPADERERGGATDGVFPLYPNRETRVEGLGGWCLEVKGNVAKGHIRFEHKKAVLFEQRFDPTTAQGGMVAGTLPKAALEKLKPGDRIEWGVWFEDTKKREVTTTVRLVKKDVVNKTLAKRVDSDKSLANYPAIREFLRAEVLMNYGMHGEALQAAMAATAADPMIERAHRIQVDALRRLDLKDAPLFRAALQRTTGDFGGGSGRLVADNPATPRPAVLPPGPSAPKPADAAKPVLGPGGPGLPGPTPATPEPAKPPTETPGAPSAPGLTPEAMAKMLAMRAQRTELVRRMQEQAEGDKAKANELRAQADKAADDAKAAEGAVDTAREAVAKAEADLAAANETPDNTEAVATAQHAVNEAQTALKNAQDQVRVTRTLAEQAEQAAKRAQEIAQESGRVADQAAQGPGLPGAGAKEPVEPPSGERETPDAMLKRATEATNNMNAARDAYNTARKTMEDAWAPLQNPDLTPEERMPLEEAFAKAKEAMDRAGEALLQAQNEAEAATSAAQAAGPK